VGNRSALDPPVQDGSQRIEPITVECKTDDTPACNDGIVGFHSAMPADPKFAEAVLPTIQKWRESNAPSSDVGGPGCAAVSKAVKKLPVTVTCTGNDVLIAGKCVARREPHREIDPPKPVVPPEQADPSKDVEQSNRESEQNTSEERQSNESSGESSCPNGMVRVGPETDTSSGCAPATDKQPQPQQQSDEPSNDSPCPNGMVGPGPDAQGHSGCFVPQEKKSSSPTKTTEPDQKTTDPGREIATDGQGGDPKLCAEHPTYEWCHTG
jgi:hypothetical protein